MGELLRDHGELRVRLAAIEGSMKALENDLVMLKAQNNAYPGRFDRIEADLRGAEKELASLQGQGVAHGVRLDTIDKTLQIIRTDLSSIATTITEEGKAYRSLLGDHVKAEESFQRKVIFGVMATLVSMLISIVLMFFQSHIP